MKLIRPKSQTLIGVLTSVLSVAFTSYHLWTTATGMPVSYLHRPLFVAFAVSLGFLLYSITGKKQAGKASWLDIILAITAAICFGSMAGQYEIISERLSMVDELSRWQVWTGGLSILLVLEITRRTVGAALSIVAIISLLYALFGMYMPSMVAHRGFAVVDIIDHLSLGLEGIYSIPIGVASTYIVIFIIFGTFLEKSGAGDVMMDLGKSIAGHYRGGPAKIGVLTSAFFGSISGSAAANVYATGTFTIPMMKKIGYSKGFAGAVEASASTGGQLVPPVMGAAAFLMADTLGIPYIQVCKAALIPSFLYFFSLLLMIDFQSARQGLKGLDKEKQPKIRDTLKRGYLLIPVPVLLIVMLMGYTPFLAAFAATICTVFISLISPANRMGFKEFIETLKLSAQRTVLIASACAAAGIIIGVVTLTGIGLNLTSIILTASGGFTLVALILIMVASIVMGMGTPTTVAYVIVATLGVPSLTQLGFAELPSHFFVFYFGVLSMVTPPVAVAAYAAAEIAEENMMKIGFIAAKLCFVAFLIPFTFIYDTGLLMQGPWLDILSVLFTSMVGVVAIAASFQGWLFTNLRPVMRLCIFICAILLFTPGTVYSLTGLMAFAVLAALIYIKTKNEPGMAGTEKPA